MIAAGSRTDLDIPFLEMEPVSREPQEEHPVLGALHPGVLIADRYRVVSHIAEGGMGVLYACEDLVLAREVAVKLMQREIAEDPQISQRLLREAQLAAQLHKHVAQVFDCGMLASGEPYIVMELLHGRDLYSVLKDTGPLSPDELVGYLLQLCVGLAEAHEKGIIHRDLKPENLFCAEQPDGSTVLKIVDFGVSKQLSSRQAGSRTNPSDSVGSPQYMSPEQITTPSEVDLRTDLWSIGVLMFELLTGSAPFRGAGPAQVCAAVLTQPIAPLSDYRHDVPPALEAIVLRCLQRDRGQRFASVAELAAALGALSAGDRIVGGVFAEPRERVKMSRSPGPRRVVRRWLGALCALAVVGACAAVLGLAVREGRLQLPHLPVAALHLQRAISGWKVRFLSATTASEPALADREPGLLAPAAAISPPRPLTNVQVRSPAPPVQTGKSSSYSGVAPSTEPAARP